MSNSCSFRITRSAEDLAKTISVLSQRLVSLEQRLEVLELTNKQKPDEQPAQQLEMLDSVDKMMKECQEILQPSSTEQDDQETINEEVEENWEDEQLENEFAA
tara:strand:+ start:2653 stop:2961 length:309 start_codon:yes stop_codon:yes gene_type:complete